MTEGTYHGFVRPAVVSEVIEQHNAAVRPADPDKLAAHRHGIRHDVHDVGSIDRVEGGIRKCQVCRIHTAERYMLDPMSCESNPCAVEHVGRQIDRDDATVRWIARRAQAGADTDFKNRLASQRSEASQRAPPAWRERDAVDQVVDWGETLVQALDSVRHARFESMTRRCDNESTTAKNPCDDMPLDKNYGGDVPAPPTGRLEIEPRAC